MVFKLKFDVCVCCYVCFCKKVVGIEVCLCFVVNCLVCYVFVQLVDDSKGYIVVLVLMFEIDLCLFEGDKIVKVCKVGEFFVECVKVVGVFEVVFDCGGNCYVGCVVVIVDGVCEGGLVL